jgi:23S rRNA maturation mini-RNase III
MKPQSAPTTTAARKPLRKNSYSKGNRKDINVQIVQAVQALQAVFGRFELFERLERFERVVI